MARNKRRRPRRQPIKDRMNTEQLRSAGVGIDLPSEAASGSPQPLRYESGRTSDDPSKPWNQGGGTNP